MLRKPHAISVHRRVVRIQASFVRRVMRAAIAKAKGTLIPTKPRYSVGGWNVIPGWRSRGFNPLPSAGKNPRRAKGLTTNVISTRKNEPMPIRMAITYGINSRF